jgi:hypothetical protein
LMHERFGFTLSLGLRTTCPFDVGARPVVVPIEKQHARPDVDGLVVLRREVMIETGEQQAFNARVAFSDAQLFSWCVVGSQWIHFVCSLFCPSTEVTAACPEQRRRVSPAEFASGAANSTVSGVIITRYKEKGRDVFGVPASLCSGGPSGPLLAHEARD